MARSVSPTGDTREPYRTVTRKVFLVLHATRLRQGPVERAEAWDCVSFCVARCFSRPCDTAVAVGILDAPRDAQELPEITMDAMRKAVLEHEVRCTTGVFGSTTKQMPAFAKDLPMATRWPVAQQWKSGETGDRQVAQAFCSYTLLFGTSSNMSRPPVADLMEAAWTPSQQYAPSVADAETELPL